MNEIRNNEETSSWPAQYEAPVLREIGNVWRHTGSNEASSEVDGSFMGVDTHGTISIPPPPG